MANFDWLSKADDTTFNRIYRHYSGTATLGRQAYTPTDRYWEDRFCNVITKPKIHGSSDECFENAAYKIRNLCIETPRIQETEQQLLSLVDRAVIDPSLVEYRYNGLNMLVAHLLSRGYTKSKSIIEFAVRRVNDVYDGITSFGHNIYLKDGEAKRVPKAFLGRKVVNPDLIRSGIISLPQTHDILYFYILGKHRPEYLSKINQIIAYIFTKEYQSYPPGYGIGLYGERYYAIGWSIHIPSFTSNMIGPSTIFDLVHLSNYATAVQSVWFGKMLNELDKYQIDDASYEFPKDSIREKKNVYFVGGGHMGVVANRRLKQTRRIESTYWYCRIKENARNAV